MAQAAIQWVPKAVEKQELSTTAGTATVSLFRSRRQPSSKQQSEDSYLETSQVKTVEQERAWSAYGVDEASPVNVYGRKMVDEGAESISFASKSRPQEHPFNISRQELRKPSNNQCHVAVLLAWIL